MGVAIGILVAICIGVVSVLLQASHDTFDPNDMRGEGPLTKEQLESYYRSKFSPHPNAEEKEKGEKA